MKDERKDFKEAFERLTSKGEMCDGEPPRFQPAGIRKNVQEEGPLYHGTKAELKIGDYIIPGYPSNYGARKKANFVYTTALIQGAALAAELAEGSGKSRVFIVEPQGPIEDDPNVTDKKFPGNPSRSYRTREPMKIVGEVESWERLAPEVLNKLKQKMEEAARLGIEAINE